MVQRASLQRLPEKIMGHSLILDAYHANEEGEAISDAFPRRSMRMAGRSRKTIDTEKFTALWPRLLNEERSGKGLIYIHVPFCANRCLFCGFYKNAWHERHSVSYSDLLIAEMEREADKNVARTGPIHAVYFGGGTPTALAADDLARIIRTLRRLFPLTPDCEITIEGRIYHFDEEKIDACIEAGANRFSIGIQSFNTEVRKRQGRKSDQKTILSFMDMLTSKDSAAVVCDLMFGLPMQTEEVWREDLRICTDLALDGADLYCLSVFPNGALFQSIQKGKMPAGASLREQGRMYAYGMDAMAKAGWAQISNSHWARTTRERNLYNLLVKGGANILAYGSGAGGRIGRYSYSINGDLETYSEQTTLGEKAVSSMSEADPILFPLEGLISAGIETGRLDLLALSLLLPVEGFAAALQPLLAQWARSGMIEDGGMTIRLTPAGRFWQSNLIGALHAALADFIYGPLESNAHTKFIPPLQPSHHAPKPAQKETAHG